RITEHVTIRLKNLSVQRGVAVVLLGNLRERIAGLHDMSLGVGIVGRRVLVIRHGVLRLRRRDAALLPRTFCSAHTTRAAAADQSSSACHSTYRVTRTPERASGRGPHGEDTTSNL